MDLIIISQKMMMRTTSSIVSLGALSISSHMAAKGFSVRFIENNSFYKSYGDGDFIRMIERESPMVVGLSVNILNAVGSYRTVEVIKRHFPDQIIVGGGLHSYEKPEEMIERGMDVVVVGEAEIAFPRLMRLIQEYGTAKAGELFASERFMKELMKIPGLATRSGRTRPGEIVRDLDELPLIDYGVLNIQDLVHKPSDLDSVVNIVNFQRGCPFACTFCKTEFMEGKIRNNSDDYMVRQITKIIDEFDIHHFQIVDSNFPITKDRMRQFCELLIELGLNEKISINFQTSVTIKLSDEELTLLKMAGVSLINIGVERLDDNFRKLLKKAGTGRQCFDLAEKIKKNGIKTNCNILVNFPQETIGSIERESELIPELLKHTDAFAIYYFVSVPGTEIYDENLSSAGDWYLKEEIYDKRMSYYDYVFQVHTPSAEFNLFGLDLDTLAAMRKLKEKYYIESIGNLSRSLFFSVAFRADTILARFSRVVYKLSPGLESVLFFPFKFFRMSFFKFFTSRYYYKKAE